MSLIRRTILLTLSLLVLMSSIGFSMGVHFCAGTLQDFAFFHKAEACPMEQKQKPLPCHSEAAGEAHAASDEMSCCDDSLIVVESVDDALASKDAVHLKKPALPLLAVLQTALLFLQPQETVQLSVPYTYFSPPLVRDIPLLVQSFLI